MTSRELNNLVRTGLLVREPPDRAQIEGIIRSAQRQLNDLKLEGLSIEGRFRFAYGAAHALALAALRMHGFRTDKRFLVFQCLPHTVGLNKTKSRVLVQCHDLRNRAEYEGEFDVAPRLIDELTEIVDELLELVRAMEPVG